jgi:photosystem II stability/assembly factor-like uncharacterized protein
MTVFDPTSQRSGSADARGWKLLLSGEGGIVLDLLFGEHDDIVAVTRLGLFRSTDRGDHWSRIEAPSLVLTLHRSKDWWLGTDVGLFRSASLDASWQPVLSRTAITAVAVIDHGDLVLAASVEEGLLRSEDGGINWEDANPGLPGDDLLAIRQSPQFQHDQLIFVATASGLFRSRNGGRAWRRVGLDADDIQCFDVVDHELLIGTGGHGLWRSPDVGKTWHASHLGQAILGFGTSEAGSLFVLAESGNLALDASSNAQSQSSLPPDTSCAITIGDRTLVGTMGKAVVQLELGGLGWTALSTGLEATARDRVCVIGRSQLVTTSSASTMLLSTDSGSTWSELLDAPLGSVSDFDARVNGDDRLEIVACDSHVACVYRESWQTIDMGAPLAVAWLDGEPAVITCDGDFVCNEFRSSIFPWRPRLIAAQLFPVHGRPEIVWSLLHTENAGVIILRSPDGGKRWEPLLQTDTTTAVSLAVTVGASGKESALAAVGNRIYRVLESPAPVWSADEDLTISAIAICPDERVLLATNRGLYVVSQYFETSRRVAGSPAVLLDVDITTDEGAVVIERGGSIWLLEELPYLDCA